MIVDEAFERDASGVPTPHRDESLRPFPRNYDDWNERFWALPSLLGLHTHAGLVVMAVPPHERWALLLDADWERFFAATPKTFRAPGA